MNNRDKIIANQIYIKPSIVLNSIDKILDLPPRTNNPLHPSNNREQYACLFNWMQNSFESLRKSCEINEISGKTVLEQQKKIVTSGLLYLSNLVAKQCREKGLIISLVLQYVIQTINAMIVHMSDHTINEMRKNFLAKKQLSREYDTKIFDLQNQNSLLKKEKENKWKNMYLLIRDNRVLRRQKGKLLRIFQEHTFKIQNLQQQLVASQKDNQKYLLMLNWQEKQNEFNKSYLQDFIKNKLQLCKLEKAIQTYPKKAKKLLNQQLEKLETQQLQSLEKKIQFIIKAINEAQQIVDDVQDYQQFEKPTKMLFNVFTQTQCETFDVGINTTAQQQRKMVLPAYAQTYPVLLDIQSYTVQVNLLLNSNEAGKNTIEKYNLNKQRIYSKPKTESRPGYIGNNYGKSNFAIPPILIGSSRGQKNKENKENDEKIQQKMQKKPKLAYSRGVVDLYFVGQLKEETSFKNIRKVYGTKTQIFKKSLKTNKFLCQKNYQEEKQLSFHCNVIDLRFDPNEAKSVLMNKSKNSLKQGKLKSVEVQKSAEKSIKIFPEKSKNFSKINIEIQQTEPFLQQSQNIMRKQTKKTISNSIQQSKLKRKNHNKVKKESYYDIWQDHDNISERNSSFIQNNLRKSCETEIQNRTLKKSIDKSKFDKIFNKMETQGNQLQFAATAKVSNFRKQIKKVAIRHSRNMTDGQNSKKEEFSKNQSSFKNSAGLYYSKKILELSPFGTNKTIKDSKNISIIMKTDQIHQTNNQFDGQKILAKITKALFSRRKQIKSHNITMSQFIRSQMKCLYGTVNYLDSLTQFLASSDKSSCIVQCYRTLLNATAPANYLLDILKVYIMLVQRYQINSILKPSEDTSVLQFLKYILSIFYNQISVNLLLKQFTFTSNLLIDPYECFLAIQNSLRQSIFNSELYKFLIGILPISSPQLNFQQLKDLSLICYSGASVHLFRLKLYCMKSKMAVHRFVLYALRENWTKMSNIYTTIQKAYVQYFSQYNQSQILQLLTNTDDFQTSKSWMLQLSKANILNHYRFNQKINRHLLMLTRVSRIISHINKQIPFPTTLTQINQQFAIMQVKHQAYSFMID